MLYTGLADFRLYRRHGKEGGPTLDKKIKSTKKYNKVKDNKKSEGTKSNIYRKLVALSTPGDGAPVRGGGRRSRRTAVSPSILAVVMA